MRKQLFRSFSRLTLNLAGKSISSTATMANSKFEYVRDYEEASDPVLLRNCFVVARVDGKHFHQFAQEHQFYKPNDKRALDLMVEAAKYVMQEFYPNIVIAYGQSDEFSFVFRRETNTYKRRSNKITSLVVSAFTSAYVFNWSKFFETGEDGLRNTSLKYPPTFDGRCVLYPTEEVVIDYLKWRQVDCHINNLYNTTYAALRGTYTRWPPSGEEAVKQDKKCSGREATERLNGTFSSDKNEILFSEYGINYNNEPEQFKKGSVLLLRPTLKTDKVSKMSPELRAASIEISVASENIITDQFWETNRDILQFS